MNPNNTASSLLAKIGGGTADADFARAMSDAIDRVHMTNKGAKLVLTIDIKPREERGCLEMRAHVEARLPRLPTPASQMHVGAAGELLTQTEFILGGGPSETPKPIPQAPATSVSGRLTVAKPPLPGPVAAAPAPAPVKTGKED